MIRTAGWAFLLMIGCGGGNGEEDSSSNPVAGPIVPGNPGNADVQFTIDSQVTRPISRFIYGENGHSWSPNATGATLERWGGNRSTAYNWENNASNAGTDWFNQNDSYAGGGDVAGEAVRMRVAPAHAANAGAIVTVPMCGYVAADKGNDGDVNQTPNYLQTRFRQVVNQKPAAFAYPPSTADAYVYVDEFVWWLNSKFPTSTSDANRPIFYALDNEPDLWPETHPRIHPQQTRYDEMVQKTVATAGAIKDVLPNAKIFGSVNYGFYGYVALQGAPDANGQDYLEYFLSQMALAHQQQNRRLVDVLDLHWYTEARANGVYVSSDDASPATAAARVQAPRSLWDTTYAEDSWIANDWYGGPIYLLPRLQARIDAHYPGTKLAFTEYYYGGGAHISGGIAQADVLGIFGRDGVFAATLWRLGQTDHRFIYGAFKMYRNFDGQNGAFGDTSISAVTTNAADSSVYASVDAGNPNRMVVVAINKTNSARTAGITITHAVQFTKADVYQLTSGSSNPVFVGTLAIDQVNALVYSMPAMSVSTIVLKP